MDALDAFLRLHHAAGNAGWLREALMKPPGTGDAPEPAAEPAAAGWSAGALIEAPVRDWLAAGAPIGAREAALSIEAEAHVATVRAWLARSADHVVLGWADADYPSLLRDAPNPPTALFVHGQAECLWWPQIAIVGSRAPTPAGRERAARWSRAFGEAGFVVTSGLAAGIDAAAHGAALDGPGTVAVTGTGPDRCFPAAHRGLHTAIAGRGCVVTEHAPGVEARPEHFPSRNRIIAGLSLGTVVIEAAQRSGALITARLAGEAGREVFALPGAPENLKARGCHRLIRDGALLVDAPEQVVEALAAGVDSMARRLRRALGAARPAAVALVRTADDPANDEAGAGLLRVIGAEGLGFDELLTRSGLTPASLAPILLTMELEGRLTQQHGVYLPCG